MLRTFNCGLGGVLIVEGAHEGEVLKLLEEAHECGYTVGKIADAVQGEQQVQVSSKYCFVLFWWLQVASLNFNLS